MGAGTMTDLPPGFRVVDSGGVPTGYTVAAPEAAGKYDEVRKHLNPMSDEEWAEYVSELEGMGLVQSEGAERPVHEPSSVPWLDPINAFGTSAAEAVPFVGPWLSQVGNNLDASFASAVEGKPVTPEERRAIDLGDQAQYPTADVAGDVAGSVLPLLPLGATSLGAKALGMSGSLPSRVFFGSLSGAGIAGGDKAIRTGDPLAALDAAGFGALLGGGLPLVGGTLGAIGRLLGKGNKAPPNEFDIPLTTAQRTGDLRQFGQEERLRQVDGSGQPIMRQFDKQQAEAIERASDEMIGAKLGDPANMEDNLARALRDKVAASKQRASQLYDFAEQSGAVLDEGAVRVLPDYVQQRLAANSVIVDASITPSAALALKEIEAAGALKGGLDPLAPKTGPINGDLVGVSLKGVEQVRKRLVGLSGNTPEDRRAVYQIKKAFDDWLDDAVDRALISGDETALKALKAARAETAFHKKLTTPESGDEVTDRIAKMQDQDATAEQVANWLYGADIASPVLMAPRVAGKLKQVLGAGSPEFGAIRAAAWKRLVTDLASGNMRSATMIAKRVEQFLNSKGVSLSKVLYSEAERAQMQRFADLLKKTVTPRDATNPSRTGWTLNNMANGITKLIAGGAGLQMGGPTGSLAAMLAVPVFKNVAGARAARKAVSGVVDPTAKTASVATRYLPPGAAGVAVPDDQRPDMLQQIGGMLRMLPTF